MTRSSRRLLGLGADFTARSAARGRLPAWLKVAAPLLSLVSVFTLVALLFAAANAIHSLARPGVTLATAAGPSELLMFLGSFVAALAPGFLIANLALWAVPPTRRVLDQNAKGVPGASFRRSMMGLSKLAIVLTAPGLGLALLGAIEPWAK
jgi:hypothetical protein